MPKAKELGEYKWLELTAQSISALEDRLAGNSKRPKSTTMGEFLLEAKHLVGVSLVDGWIAEGTTHPAAIIKRMREELGKRRVSATTAERSNGSLNDVVPESHSDDEDDIPF